MDSADMTTETPRSQTVLASQGVLLGQHEQSIRTLMKDNQGIHEQLARLTDQVHLVSSTQPASVSPAPQPPVPTESYVPDPELFAGDFTLCRGFLLQCAMVFNQHLWATKKESSSLG